MLPIHGVLSELKTALGENASAVLVAPPGAGKTTVVPLALLDEPWLTGRKIIVLEPRRLAARAAASRMASSLGEAVGARVGFRVRLQSKVSSATRIEVVTEGVFTRMILADPALEEVGAVLFDEFHERSLDADLGLAFARDSQAILRPDLRLLVMSATLDGAKIASLLGGAPVIESQGRAFPVETRYLGKDPSLRLEDQVARAVQKALREEEGGVLVFLPGQGEIRRVAERLAERISDPSVDVALLYGALAPAEQDRAISPSPAGRRKVVLATSIAQTSLTLEGIRVVVDSGLSRVPRFDPASGLTRLATVKVSRAAADQRKGRAGRTQSGICYRLWEEAETRALPPYDRPEILETDLAKLALDMARWGARDAGELALLDPPPAAALAEARALLGRIEALAPDGSLTGHGRQVAAMALPPRLAHLVIKGAALGAAGRAAEIAAVITERGLGGRDTDLRRRLELFAKDSSALARDARLLAARWLRGAPPVAPRARSVSDGLLLAEAYPERIACARGATGEYLLAGGRGAFLPATDPLACEPWLAVADLGGGTTRDRILLAAPIAEPELLAAFAGRITTEDVVGLDARGRVQALRRRVLGSIVVEERILDGLGQDVIESALLDHIRREGLEALPWDDGALMLRARVGLLRSVDGVGWPDFSDEGLKAGWAAWLPRVLEGCRRLADIKPEDLAASLLDLLSWEQREALARLAPERWTAPTGSRLLIDYSSQGGPTVAVRVQELFGLGEHPRIVGGQTPLTLALLSPAHRPIQITKDLPGFWSGTWKEVRADMRGRYPKHVWPESPASAAPTTRAKPRG